MCWIYCWKGVKCLPKPGSRGCSLMPSVFVTALALANGKHENALPACTPRTTSTNWAAASPSLGPQWKRGFLDGGEKRPARPPSATTPGARGKPPAVGSAVPSSNIDEVAPSKAHAFRETVVEKPNLVGPVRSVLDSKPAIATATAGAPARVSRFKARRQGL